MLIAVVTPLYPTRLHPHRGQAVYETTAALRNIADVRVLCAQAVYPQSTPVTEDGPLHSPDERLTIIGYSAIPMLSRPWNGANCARRLHKYLADLRPDVILN